MNTWRSGGEKRGGAVSQTALTSRREEEEIGLHLVSCCVCVCVHLRYAEDQRQAPGHHDGGVPAGHGPTSVGLQRAADGVVPVHRHGDDHVGGRKHAHDLQVLDGAAQEVGPLEPLGDVPYQLGENLVTRSKDELE